MAAERRGSRRKTTSRQSARQARDNPVSIEAEDVSIEIEDIEDLSESINIGIFGPTGHGKTALAGGAPNAVVMRTESGVKTLRHTGSKARILNATTWPKIEAATNWADNKLGPEDWLIVDSGNRAQLEYVRWLLRAIHEQNSSRDLDIPALQDHQKWQNAYMRWTDRIIDAPYNSIFLYIDMKREDEDGVRRQDETEAQRFAPRQAAARNRAQGSAGHHGIDVRVVPHVECAGGSGSGRNAQNGDQPGQRIGMFWREHQSHQRREYGERHHARLCKRDEVSGSPEGPRERSVRGDVGAPNFACKRHQPFLPQVATRLLSTKAPMCIAGIMF